jgi:hypothetical protein
MSDFYSQRGFANPAPDDPVSVHDFEAHQPPQIPPDYPARLRAMELAVQLTMSKFDGGQERVLARARGFHSFLMGKLPYEMCLPSAAYEAAETAIRESGMVPCADIAEAAVDAAWAVIINQGEPT